MWVVLVVVVVVVGGIAAVGLMRRPRGGDLHSVAKYHSALGTIEDISHRTSTSSVRVVGAPDAGDRPRFDDPGPHRRDPGEPLVFDDADPREGSHVAPQIPRTDRAQRSAIESMNRRPRKGTAVVVVIVIVVVFGALAYAGSRRTNQHGGSTATSTTQALTATSTPATGSGHTDKSQHGHGASKHPSTTTTTLPAKVVALSSTGVSATYVVADNSYTLTIDASAPCWVLATVATSGSTLWTGTLEPGGSQAIHATGAIKVELGAPSVTMTVDTVPVVLPSPVHTPFVATFQPSATASAGATTTTTPTG